MFAALSMKPRSKTSGFWQLKLNSSKDRGSPENWTLTLQHVLVYFDFATTITDAFQSFHLSAGHPTGCAEAIDIALQILKGEKVPKKITLGTRWFDKNNVSQGGEVLK